MTDEKVYSPAQLAETVGQPRSIIYALIAKRELAVIRRSDGPKGHIWIRWSSWLNYLERHERPAQVQASRPAPRPKADIRDLPGASRYVS